MRVPLSLSDTHTTVSVCCTLCCGRAHCVSGVGRGHLVAEHPLGRAVRLGCAAGACGLAPYQAPFWREAGRDFDAARVCGRYAAIRSRRRRAQPSKQASRRKQAAAHDRTPPHTLFPSLLLPSSTVLESEYDKRLARGGLTLNRAISEVESNMPQRAIYAELYGQE